MRAIDQISRLWRVLLTTQTGNRRGIGCLFGLMGVLAMFGGLGLFWSLAAGGMPNSVHEVSVSRHPSSEGKKVVVIKLSGLMLDAVGGIAGGRGFTSDAVRMLDQAKRDEKVAGVLLVLDTPGGSVSDADDLHHRVSELRSSGRKVVVQMGDVCASGGYYVAVAADEIHALPTTLTGSIGVVLNTLNFHGLLELYGVRDESITSGPNKQMLSPTRPVSPEQRALLQAVVDELYARFREMVLAGRADAGLTEAGLGSLADGRVFTARTALAAKLIDGIGYQKDALDRLKSIAGDGPFDVVRYEREPSLADLFRAKLSAPSGMEAAVRAAVVPRALYLYAPMAR
jgi:protease-4